MNDIKGLGIDIISIERFDKSIKKSGQKFLDKIFTKKEQIYCKKHSNSTPHYAVRFSAKEALSKALGVGICDLVSFIEIEINHDDIGKPYITLSDRINSHFKNPKIQLSLSHCKEYATAIVIVTS